MTQNKNTPSASVSYAELVGALDTKVDAAIRAYGNAGLDRTAIALPRSTAELSYFDPPEQGLLWVLTAGSDGALVRDGVTYVKSLKKFMGLGTRGNLEQGESVFTPRIMTSVRSGESRIIQTSLFTSSHDVARLSGEFPVTVRSADIHIGLITVEGAMNQVADRASFIASQVIPQEVEADEFLLHDEFVAA